MREEERGTRNGERERERKDRGRKGVRMSRRVRKKL